jgi:hypothetical protein
MPKAAAHDDESERICGRNRLTGLNRGRLASSTKNADSSYTESVDHREKSEDEDRASASFITYCMSRGSFEQRLGEAGRPSGIDSEFAVG